MRKRLQNIITRMVNGEGFYPSSCSPRITGSEVNELLDLGFRIQGQSPLNDVSVYMSWDRPHDNALFEKYLSDMKSVTPC